MVEETDTVVPAVFFFAASDPFSFSTSLPSSTSTTTLGRVTLIGVSFLCFNAIIALCLVCAKKHTRSKKAVVVRRTSFGASRCWYHWSWRSKGYMRSPRRRQKYRKMPCTRCTRYLGRWWEIQDGLSWMGSRFDGPKLFLASVFFPLPSKSRSPWYGSALWFCSDLLWHTSWNFWLTYPSFSRLHIFSAMLTTVLL